MNISGWILTLFLTLTTIYHLGSKPILCQCSMAQLDIFNPSLHRCKNGKRYVSTSLTDLEPLGPCNDSFVDYLRVLFACINRGPCLDYSFALAVALLVSCLPFCTDTQTRILLHSLLNCIKMENGALGMTATLHPLLLLVIVVGIFTFNWNLNNGDGLWGPIIRYRRRNMGNGRFTAK